MSEKENLLIIPLNNSFHSKFNTDKNLLSVLLLIENEFGVIRKGNIVQYFTESATGAKEIAPNTFYNFYNGMRTVEGTFTFLSLMGNFQYEISNRKNGTSSFKIYKNKTPDTFVPGLTNSEEQHCTSWYWVTTTTYSDGHTEENWEYLYTTCAGCNPSADCGDGNGNDNNSSEFEEEVTVVKEKFWDVYKQVDYFTIRANIMLSGKKVASETQGGHFTAASPQDTWCTGCGILLTWQPMNNDAWFGTQQAHHTVTGNVIYPPNTRNPQYVYKTEGFDFAIVFP